MKIKKGLKNIFSFSGGKDSTAMVLMAIDRGIKVDDVVFFDTGWEFPQMYDHLELFEEKTGIKITRIKPRRPLDWLMLVHEVKKGKYVGLKGYGFPWIRGRYCTREKVAALKTYSKSKGDYNSFVGIASDETHRLKRQQNVDILAPLVEWGVTEKDALNYCYNRGFTWGGLYEHFKRVSCWLCPLKPKRDLFKVWDLYPELKKDYIRRARKLEKSRRDAKNEFLKKGETPPDWCYKPVYAGYTTQIDDLIEQYKTWKVKQKQGLLILD